MVSSDGQHYVQFLRDIYELRAQSVSHNINGAADQPAKADALPQKGAPQSPKRVRDKAHLQRVAEEPCLVCGREPAQAHHLRHTQPRALSKKVSDEWTVPLCNLHHRELHDAGNEENWWQKIGIDPIAEAEKLWSGSNV